MYSFRICLDIAICKTTMHVQNEHDVCCQSATQQLASRWQKHWQISTQHVQRK